MAGREFWTVLEFQYTDVRQTIINQNLNQVSLYPNPATDVLMVDLKAYRGQMAALTIFNSFGQLMQTQSFSDIPNQAITLHLSDYKAGFYYVTIKVEQRKIETHKIIITEK